LKTKVETGYYSLQFSTLQTENKMSRHTSQPNCLNFYPTALRQSRFGYPTFGTFGFDQKQKPTLRKTKRAKFCLPANFFLNFNNIFFLQIGNRQSQLITFQ
jgi:hypothetical protein